jgi:hypothetical protein
MTEAEQFFRALNPAACDGRYLLLWTLADERSAFFTTGADALPYVKSHEKNLYAGVGLRWSDLGPKKRGTSAEVAGIFGLAADIDVKGEGHSDKAGRTLSPP